MADARAVADAGAFAVVLEKVPAVLADRITAEKNRNMDAFLKAEAALLKKNPNLSGEARRKAVEELRKKYLGK